MRRYLLDNRWFLVIDVVTSVSLWELIKHVMSWLSNLKRANESRKKESISALRKVVLASRKTAVYIRKLNQDKVRNIDEEGELSLLWTELGFELEDLGLSKLSERCYLKGKHWENPETKNTKLLEKGDLSLDKIEAMATQLIREIQS